MLSFENVNAGYDDLKVLFDVSLQVREGEVVSLVGPNGAGKTTILNIISGFVPVQSGTVTFEGHDLTKIKSHQRADLGIAHIPQGRGILNTLTVRENLILGTYHKKDRSKMEKMIEENFELFPILKERQYQMAGSLSGGQQQMLAIARSLMMEPRLLILDEPSLGLAPIVVKDMFRIISEVAKKGMAIMIVEQNLLQALGIADRGYVFDTGRITMEGPAKVLLEDKGIKEAYLGI